MHALAEAMPADRYSFKATPAQRDMAQQVLHIANANLINLRFPPLPAMAECELRGSLRGHLPLVAAHHQTA